MRLITLLFLIFVVHASSIAFAAQDMEMESASGAEPLLRITWLDTAFANFYPVPGTRLADFTDRNFGGAVRLNFMVLNITPLWLYGSFMVNENVTNSKRLDRITDISGALGFGWRFPLINRFYFTPKMSWGLMVHSTYGDYYNDPEIYPGDPRAGTKRDHYFSDQFQHYEAEFAYDLTPSFRNFQSEVFLSPSFVHFNEKHRQGLEYGYLLGIRFKFGTAFAAMSTVEKHEESKTVTRIIEPAVLAGNVIDEETGLVFKDTIPALSDRGACKKPLAEGETFAWEVVPGTGYVLKAERDGYEPVSRRVDGAGLLPGKKTSVVLAMKPVRIWGLMGSVTDRDSGEPISGVEIIATGSDVKEEEMTTGRKGEFRMEIKKDTDYDLIMKKKGYFTIRGNFSSKGKGPGWYDIKNIMWTDFQIAVVGAKMEFGNILFDSGKWNIRKDSMPILDRMAKFLFDNPKIVVELGAHTDSQGNSAYNQNLSQKRAQSSMTYLIGKGVPAEHISAMGYGESKLKNRCSDGVKCSGAEHQANRRTELQVKNILP